MPNIEKTTLGAPCWVDLSSTNLEKTKQFYHDLFGWEFDSMGEEFGNYNMISGQYGLVGGTMQHVPEMGPAIDAWGLYFATGDVQATLDEAAAHGGQVMVQPMPVADQGSMAVGIDPTGATFGLWQPEELSGFAAFGEHGYPAWFELHTRDFDASVAFYKNVLPVTLGDAEMGEDMRYYTLDIDGEQTSGIFDATEHMPADAPNTWVVYFAADDCDKAVARVQELGGQLIVPPMDSPYGRIATVLDPCGALFNLVSAGPM